MIRNPKQVGSNLLDCRPQIGKCPMDCNQCFYNRPGAFYVPINEPNIPTKEEAGDGIVRMNCGHDSNFHRSLVIKTAKQYKHFFFNTSIPRFDFPGPVVFTANANEEERASSPLYDSLLAASDNLMFVRLRVSSSNLVYIENAVEEWTNLKVPIVLTFMAYYEKEAMVKVINRVTDELLLRMNLYEWKTRHINSYFCPTKEFMRYVLERMKRIGGRLVTMCGTLDSNYCRDCRNCETYYWQTVKHMKVIRDRDG